MELEHTSYAETDSVFPTAKETLLEIMNKCDNISQEFIRVFR